MSSNGATSIQWLNPQRITLYSWSFFVMGIGQILWLVFVRLKNDPVNGADFGIFWAVARLLHEGQAVKAYDATAVHQVTQQFMPVLKKGTFGWFYPPQYFIFLYPLGWFGYLWSYLLFEGASLWLAILGLRRLLPDARWILLILGFGGVAINLGYGQNAFQTLALLTWIIVLQEKAPVRAGILAGIMCYKPQLMLMIPVMFLQNSNWRAIISGMLTLFCLVVLSMLLWDANLWLVWMRSMSLATQALAKGGNHYLAMVYSLYALVHRFGLSTELSMLVQIAQGLILFGTSIKMTRDCPDVDLNNALWILTGLMMTPYLIEYEAAILLLPLALYVKSGVRMGWCSREWIGLVLCYLLVIPCKWLGSTEDIECGYFLLLALYVMLVMRMNRIVLKNRIDLVRA